MYTTLVSNYTGRYEITQKDIDGVMRFLNETSPKHATEEIALLILKFHYDVFHGIGLISPDNLEEILDALNDESLLKLA